MTVKSCVSGGCEIIINSLMAFIEEVVSECMQRWGSFSPKRGRNGSCVVEKSTLKEREGWSTSRRRSSRVELEGRSTTACTCWMVLLGADVTTTSEGLEGILRSAVSRGLRGKGIYLKV